MIETPPFTRGRSRPGGWCFLSWCRHNLIWHVFMNHTEAQYETETALRDQANPEGAS